MTRPPRRGKWPTVVALVPAFVVALVVSGLMILPFGIAEPGQPHGFGPLAVDWALGELAWTLWTFVRRRHDDVLAGPRFVAFVIVIAGIAIGSAAGIRLSDLRHYNKAAWTMGIIVTLGCRAGRYWLRQGARAPIATVPADTRA